MRFKLFATMFAALIMVFAVVLAVLGISLPRNGLQPIIIITNFFDIMIPVVAVGAYTLLILFLINKW